MSATFKKNLEEFKVWGTPRNLCATIEQYMIGVYTPKGGGSAYGGKWKQKTEFEKRLFGKSGEIKISYKRDGTKYETKIGDNGKAVRERHYTKAPNPKYHTNPHDHIINWLGPDEHPDPGPAINYFDGNVPEFKSRICHRSGEFKMIDDESFKTISDFKQSMRYHGEVVFMWAETTYGIFWDGKRYCIAQADGANEKWCDTSDEILEYMVGSDSLRDVITQVTVIERTI